MLPHHGENTIITIGVINIGTAIGLAVVIVIIVTTIANIRTVSTAVDVDMIPRPPKSPTRTLKCPRVRATCETSWGVPRGQRHRGRVDRARLAARCAREHARASAAAETHQQAPSTHRKRRHISFANQVAGGRAE
eukprot:953887-Pyramimonas_sp.AAC.1